MLFLQRSLHFQHNLRVCSLVNPVTAWLTVCNLCFYAVLGR